MKGKIVVVTGANRGIGRVMTRELARSGAKVVMACRSMEHARQMREEIETNLGFGDLDVRELDLASPDSVRSFAKSFCADHPRLDVLINNAGVTMKKFVRLDSGLELTFAINVLGPHLLTDLLADSLRAAAPARVVNVASDFAGGLVLDDLQFEKRRYNGTKAYKQSKQANRMLSREWARRLESDEIRVNSMTPGLMPDTDLFRQEDAFGRFFMRMLGKFIGVSVEEGADTAVWLARDPNLDGASGGFYMKRRKQECKFADLEAEKTLWERCEELLEKKSE